jgi:hypothetical protein
MNEVFINALVERIKAGEMIIDQVPIPYRKAVEEKLNSSHKN